MASAGIVGREHLDGPHGPFEPAGRVDPGRQAEADHAGREPRLVEAAGHFHQGPQPDRGRPEDARQAVPDEDAVLAVERDDVGDRRQGDQAERPDQEVAEVGRGLLAVAEALADLPGELERDPRAAEVAAGVGAAGQARMDDHVGRRELGADRVVVGDDQLDAQLARERGLGDRRDAAVDRDDQRVRLRLGQLAEGLGVDAVAFLDPVRDVVDDVAGTGQLQAGPEDARAADAVDVVVAVDDDRSGPRGSPGRSARRPR